MTRLICWNCEEPCEPDGKCLTCDLDMTDPMDAPAYDGADVTVGEMIDRAEDARDAMEDR